jgi:hypothetical protein
MREASLQELLGSSFNSQMTNIFTAIPGVVVTVRNELTDMTLDVQPTINIKTKNGEVKERPVIVNVPFQFPSSSTAALTYPINVGDSVLLIFSMRGLDTWKRGNGRMVTPTDFRKFDKRDCFAIPGVFPSANSINNPAKRTWPHNTKDTVLVSNIGKNTETEVRILEAGGIIINTNQDAVVNCMNAEVVAEANITMSCQVFDLTATTATFDIGTTEWLGDINQTGNNDHLGNYTQTGNYTATGVQTFNGVIFSTHDHIPGPGPSNP